MNTAALPHVLIIDDEPDMCELLTMRLEHHGYRVTSAQTIPEGVRVIDRENLDVVIADLRLERGSGLEILDAIEQRALDLPVVVLTAHGTIETAVEAMQRGAYGFLTKPFHDHELLQKLAHAVERNQLSREVAGLRDLVREQGSDRLLGTSRRLNEVRELLQRVARTDATVLLQGASGTGKELAARTLHRQSARATAPFVAINCGALPSELLESELFGHVRGSFTGATRDKDGVFRAAGRGTLFLDEIGEAPPAVQVRLLRVLQERRFVPVGATTESEAECRIVAATNRDLRAEVRAGRFREDLFYRLHVVPIVLPTLAERREDIPLLATALVRRAAARHGVGAPAFDAEATRRLMQHPWPGNVRELANVCEAAVLLAGATITADALEPLLPTPRPGEQGAPASGEPDRDGAGVVVDAPVPDDDADVDDLAIPSLKEAREAADRSYLQNLLRRTRGNVSRAARLAGRNRTDLHELLKRYGLQPTAYRASPAASQGQGPGDNDDGIDDDVDVRATTSSSSA